MIPRLGQTFPFSDEVRINFETYGSGNQSVIFLHGFGASLRNWDDIRAYLPNGLRYFFLDLKGFGFSSKPRDLRYSVEDQAEIVNAFISQQELPRVTLVGHSYGGGVALLTYLRERPRQDKRAIEALTLIDSAGYGQTLPIFVGSFRIPFAHQILSLVPRRLQVQISLHQAFYNPKTIRKEIVDRYAYFYSLPGALESFTQAANQALPSNHNDIEQLFKEIDAPALVLWGEEDKIVPFSHALRFAQDLAGALLVPIESCGHVPQEERPDVTGRILHDFLEARSQ
jgi:pimeloyl-ACP methyl ester carboxylesterase